MKYKLLRFSLLSMLVMLFGGLASASSETETLTTNTTSGYAELTVTKGGVSGSGGALEISKGDIVVTSDKGYIKDQMTVYKGGTMNIGFKSGVSAYITKVELTVKNYHFAKPDGWTAEYTNDVTTKINTDETETFTTTATDKTSFIISNAAEGKTTVKVIKVYYEKSASVDNRIATSITFDPETAELEADVSTTFPLPTAVVNYIAATGAPETLSNAAVTWKSSNESVATISEGSNVINMVATGTATITATFDGDDTYQGSSASFPLTVNPSSTALENIAALSAQTVSGDYYVNLEKAVVTYVNGNYAYIEDASGAIVMYKSGHGLTAGNVLSGKATVTFQLRNNNPQITNLTGDYKIGTKLATAEPIPVEAASWSTPIASVLSQWFKVTGATITQEGNKFYTQLGNENVQLYGQGDARTITVDDLSATYTIIGFPTLYNSTVELQIFVQPEKEESSIPENAIWTSDKAEELTWDQVNVAIPADKFANAKVGDIIRVHLQNVKTGAANAWDAQVGLRAQNGKNLEFLVNVAGVTGSAPAEYADFLITGDILAILQSIGARIYGNECQTALVTLEGSNYTGSAESIWIGSSTDNVAISPNHFANANNFEGVKVGDIIRVTFDTPNWLGMNYQSPSWTWSEFPAGSLEMVYDWTNPVADFVVKTEEAAAILNNTDNAQIVVNAGGQDNPKTITQVELIAGSEEEPHLYVLGDMNGWDRVNMIELGYNNDADAFEYSITVDKPFYLAFSENQMTQKEADNDNDWSKFNASYRLAPQEGNFTPTLDEQVQLIYVDGCIVLEPGTYTFYITKDLKMTVTGEATPIVEDVSYIVAGSPASVFEDEWNPVSLNSLMTRQDDGTYAITYEAVQPQNGIQFKVVMWTENADEPTWIGDENGNNVTFNVTSECDVTITYDPKTGKITVTGDGVEFATEFEYESVYVAGNGNGSWLNGENWTPNAEANKMTKVADDVWECTVDLSNIALDTNLEFKFTIDGAWTHNFGGSFIGFGQKTAAVYGGSNIVIPFKDIKNSTYKLRLDLSDFDLATKEGAKFTVSIVEDIVPVANLGTAYNMLELGEEPVFVDIELKNARVTMVQQVKYGEFLEKLGEVGMKYYKDNGAKQGLFKAPKKDVELDTPMDFAIIEDETGAMPFLACFLEDNGVSEGSVLNGDIVVILSNDFFPLALGDKLEASTSELTEASLQALEVTDGTAGPTEITADNAEEYKSNFGFRYVKFSESELTVGSSSSEEQRASTLKLGVIDETVDIGDFLGTGAILDEDGTVSVEGFMYEMFGAKLFQPTKMESGTNGINSVRFFENAKGTIYNLNGQRVTTPQKGVMIVNGKKVVVK